MAEVLVVESWPDAPGHPARMITRRAKRKAASADGRYWLVRERGILRRWKWLPVRGMFVRLHEVAAPEPPISGTTERTRRG